MSVYQSGAPEAHDPEVTMVEYNYTKYIWVLEDLESVSV